MKRHHRTLPVSILAFGALLVSGIAGCPEDAASPGINPVGDAGPDITSADAVAGDVNASDTSGGDATTSQDGSVPDAAADASLPDIGVDTPADLPTLPDASVDVGPGDTATADTEGDASDASTVDAVLNDTAAPDAGPDLDSESETSDAGTADNGGDTGIDATDVAVPTDDPGQLGPLSWIQEGGELSVPGGIFGEKVNLTVYTPDAPGPHPLVVLSHGFQLGPGDYTSYAKHLATWGFTAVLPAYPGSLIAPRTHNQLKDDLTAVLDWAVASYEPTVIGLAGHSMGGKISLLTATQDERPAAIFGIDPVDAGPPFTLTPQEYPSVTPELMPQITVPMVLVGETTDASGALGPACAPADNNYEQYFDHADSPALRIDVLGASHMSFLDNPACGLPCSACKTGTDDPEETKLLTRRYMTAFFKVTLAGDTSYMAWLTGSFMANDESQGLVTTATTNGFL